MMQFVAAAALFLQIRSVHHSFDKQGVESEEELSTDDLAFIQMNLDRFN